MSFEIMGMSKLLVWEPKEFGLLFGSEIHGNLDVHLGPFLMPDEKLQPKILSHCCFMLPLTSPIYHHPTPESPSPSCEYPIRPRLFKHDIIRNKL